MKETGYRSVVSSLLLTRPRPTARAVLTTFALNGVIDYASVSVGRNKEIATRQGISVRTIETHRRSIMEKLNANSIVELVHYAIRNDIVGPTSGSFINATSVR